MEQGVQLQDQRPSHPDLMGTEAPLSRATTEKGTIKIYNICMCVYICMYVCGNRFALRSWRWESTARRPPLQWLPGTHRARTPVCTVCTVYICMYVCMYVTETFVVSSPGPSLLRLRHPWTGAAGVHALRAART